MARRGALGGFSLNLFGGSSVDANVFNIASQSKSNEAYLALTRVEVQWEAGKVSNADYLAALDTYVKTFAEGTSERLNQQARLESTTYRIERNVLVSQVNSGSKTLSDLLTYDQSKLSGLNPDSQEYMDRTATVNTTQNQLMNEEEKKVSTAYSDGKMTTTQLQAWYKDRLADPRFAGNPAMNKDLNDRITELDGRIVDERDAQMVADYSAGKVSPTSFLLYAGKARARYADGTTEAKDWDKRIDTASDAAVEDDLNYRYSLSQDYARLQQFVATNKAPAAGTSTSHSTSTRTILGADGKWKVVKTTTSKTKPTAPSAAELKAWQQRKIEVESAKAQMASIANKLSGMPGGFVQSSEMLGFYKKQLGTVSKNSAEWYTIQGKVDSINATIASEKVLSKQGLKLSYPKVKSEKAEKYTLPGVPAKAAAAAPETSGGGGTTATTTGAKKSSSTVTMESFLHALAKTESGGRYNARNSTTGAYGKYQILPSNWASYAKRWLGDANAKPTPENQDKLAERAFAHYYKKYDGDWAKMAAAWHAGVAGSAGGPSTWGPKTRHYVATVMARAGSSFNPNAPAGTSAPAPSGSGSTGGGGAPAAVPAAKGAATSSSKNGTPVLKVITGVKYPSPVQKADARYGAEMSYGTTQPQLQDLELPTGLDAAQFNKVYDAVESAFLKGQEAATVTLGSGNTLHIFIGDDPDEKIAFMRDMDDQRVALRDVEAEAYKGTASEATKSNSALVARREKAGHEMVILTMAGTSTGGKSNPVTAAIRSLDSLASGVALHTKLMNEAWARGDDTAAYLEAQMIEQLTNPPPIVVNGKQVPVGNLDHMRQSLAEAQARIGTLSARTGMTPEELITGMGPAGTTLQKDLDRLTNAEDEIAKIAKDGEETALEMKNMLAKDGNGQVVWAGQGQNAQVLMKPDFVRVVDNRGVVKRQLAERGVTQDGKYGPLPPDKTVTTFIKSGNNIVDAYAKYTVERVGTVLMPDGSKIPLMGKKVSVQVDKDSDGVAETTSTYFENPLSPGTWSSTLINYKAPKGAEVKYLSGSSEPVMTFPVDNQINAQLIPDKATGVYVVSTSTNATGPFTPATEPVPVGTPDSNPTARAIVDNFQRDKSGLGPYEQFMSNIKVPALGFSPSEWAKTQIPGAVGSQRYGPPVPQDGYKPAGSTPTNMDPGIGSSVERNQAAIAARQRADEATQLVRDRAAERASLSPLPASRPPTNGVRLPDVDVTRAGPVPGIQASVPTIKQPDVDRPKPKVIKPLPKAPTMRQPDVDRPKPKSKPATKRQVTTRMAL
jgi:hypothetical protein